jgi:hypothetical protein
MRGLRLRKSGSTLPQRPAPRRVPLALFCAGYSPMIPMKRLLLLLALGISAAAPALAAKLSFENRSEVTIPLEIPGVMNPNLSPKSKSGVTLERGQKVFFRMNGRRELLLEITDEQDGQVVIVDALVAKRSAELVAKK